MRWGITLHIQRISNEVLRVEEGSLYPALHRMEQERWIVSEMGCQRKQSPCPLLSAHSTGPQAVKRRAAELEADHQCGRHGAGIQIDMK